MIDLLLTIFIILAFIALVYLLAKNNKPCDGCNSWCDSCFKAKREEEQKMLDSDEMFP